MTPTQIKMALLQAGIRQVTLAREYGCTPGCIHNVIHGYGRAQGVEALIAKRINRSVGEVFPVTRSPRPV